jgi:hypothetical protein
LNNTVHTDKRDYDSYYSLKGNPRFEQDYRKDKRKKWGESGYKSGSAGLDFALSQIEKEMISGNPKTSHRNDSDGEFFEDFKTFISAFFVNS